MKSMARLFDDNAMGIVATGAVVGLAILGTAAGMHYMQGYDMAMMTAPAVSQAIDGARDALTGLPENAITDMAVGKGFEAVGEFFFNNKIGVFTGLAGIGSLIGSAIIYNVAKKREYRRHCGYYE